VGTLLCVLLICEARRIKVRGPARVASAAELDEEDERQQQVQYAEEPQGGLTYNGLYGQAVERSDEPYERPTARTALAQPNRAAARVKDTPREPPVETIRNYSNINDDGSFTFGYESADGSFKEETRGTDCVVRGKYGYVDPDGNKREFTYVSGNPCDPNAPKDEDEEKEPGQLEDSGEENIPQNVGRPLRPLATRPQRPTPIRPATTVFQNSYNSADEEDEEQQVYVQPAPARPRPVPVRPANVVRVTPRPAPTTLPATTYRPQLLVSVTPRPNVVLHKQSTAQPTTLSNFDEELKRFQLGNSATTPRPFASQSATAAPRTPTGQPIYTTELVFDPRSGQYNTVVYQQVPKSGEDINLRTRLPQYVPSPTPQYVTPAPPPQPSPQPNLLQQQLFQQQKQNLFQQSQDLYNQQRQQQLQTQQHRFQQPSLLPANTKSLDTSPQKFNAIQPQTPLRLPQLQSTQPQRPLSLPQFGPSEPLRPAQQFYYFAPQQDVSGSLQGGQIDAFLRNHNLQF